MSKLIGALAVMLAFVSVSEARVHSVPPKQYLALPDAEPLEGFPALAVAIDGDSLVAIVDRTGGRFALLYRRDANGHWAYSRTLLQTSVASGFRRAGLAMKNNLAVIDLAGQAFIWEKVSGNWVKAGTEGDILQPGGYAISSNSILVGGTGCDWDGFIYQKLPNNSWGISGRLPAQSGLCSQTLERDVEFNYDYVLINQPAGTVRVYRRNGAALDWQPAGIFPLQGQSAGHGGTLALQKTIAAAPGSAIYWRDGGVWKRAGTLTPIDYAEGSGDASQVLYRDSALLTVEGLGSEASSTTPHVYALNNSRNFDNVGILNTRGNILDLDISGKTVVVASEDWSGLGFVSVFNLPATLTPPAAIANDFNAQDVSGFQAPAGGFVLAGNVSNHFYRQPQSSGDHSAILTNSNWDYFQAVNVQIWPTGNANENDSWVGAAVQYMDANNYYYVAVRPTSVEIGRRLNGVNTTLAAQALGRRTAGAWHKVRFGIEANPFGDDNGRQLFLQFDDDVGLGVYDNSLSHGRVALLTHNARADYENLFAAPAAERPLLYMNGDFPEEGRPLTTAGGTWVPPDRNVYPTGWRQTNANAPVLATALQGSATEDQRVHARVRLDSWGSTNPVPWFGVLARYVDVRNYYYLSVRGSNQVQIRKVVDAVTTVLASAAFTATAGEMHDYELRALGNELHALVDGKVVATAIDDTLKRGLYGVATYHATALFNQIMVYQP
jgi:hypothetical protein